MSADIPFPPLVQKKGPDCRSSPSQGDSAGESLLSNHADQVTDGLVVLAGGGLLQVNGVVEGVEVDGLVFFQDRLRTEVEAKGVEVLCVVRPLNNCEVVEVVVEGGLLSGPVVEEGLTGELVDTLVAPA